MPPHTSGNDISTSETATHGRLRLGTQGWNYPAWVGPFYPEGTRPAEFLRTFARAFDVVEIDSTFYAIPPASTVRGWGSRVPDHFTFSAKMPQEITHERRFVDCADTLHAFCDRMRELGSRLGPILIQCGPDFSPQEVAAFSAFLPLLPRDLRFAVEFRQPTWIRKRTLALLSAHGVALALSDGRWISRDWLLKLCTMPTADFAYLRWMGPDRRITDYSRVQEDRGAELDAWAAMIPVLLGNVKEVFGFVNNHFAGHAPASVRMLQERLGMPTVDPRAIGEQPSLF
jgi:uncharacterized protein YecE (DUF72 family)